MIDLATVLLASIGLLAILSKLAGVYARRYRRLVEEEKLAEAVAFMERTAGRPTPEEARAFLAAWGCG